MVLFMLTFQIAIFKISFYNYFQSLMLPTRIIEINQSLLLQSIEVSEISEVKQGTKSRV